MTLGGRPIMGGPLVVLSRADHEANAGVLALVG